MTEKTLHCAAAREQKEKAAAVSASPSRAGTTPHLTSCHWLQPPESHHFPTVPQAGDGASNTQAWGDSQDPNWSPSHNTEGTRPTHR